MTQSRKRLMMIILSNVYYNEISHINYYITGRGCFNATKVRKLSRKIIVYNMLFLTTLSNFMPYFVHFY
jgi:hypothetical protein